MSIGNLDRKFIDSLTPENVQVVFDALKRAKTDVVPRYKVKEIIDDTGKSIKRKELLDPVKIARGCDGVDHKKFQEKMEINAAVICNKGKTGEYVFMPFMEMETTKPPFGKGLEELEKARQANKIRPISISTIRDTVFQKILADTLSYGKEGYAEVKFKNTIDLNSYGYRDGKSSKMAVTHIQQHIEDGYVYILDGDIEKFFDKINHNLLERKMLSFFGSDNVLIQKYLRKFIKVHKILPNGIESYWKDKNCFEYRNIGIPQGGVLSGLLANVFLYDFDLYVVNELMPKYDFKYLRYADDFVLMFKEDTHTVDVFDQLANYLAKEDLTLHPLPPAQPEEGKKYSKNLNVGQFGNDAKKALDFLGFEITPTHLRVKGDNYKKFRKRIVKTLSDIKVKEIGPAYFYHVVTGINKRITALENDIEHKNGLCPHCGKLIQKRSWIGYFMMIDDTRQLRNLDTMIRAEIYRDHRIRTNGKHLPESVFMEKLSGEIDWVLRTYYKYKKQVRKYAKKGFCQNRNRYFNPLTQKIAVYPPCEIQNENTP